MTPGQLELLGRLSKDELLAVMRRLVWGARDLEVVLAASEALGGRVERLRSAWRVASGDTEAAAVACKKRPRSAAALRAYREAAEAEDRRWKALRRCQDERTRILNMETPL
ncbi:hypothetical protein [Inquilinus sp. CA228]|uniref:hypothetical protein n=1 Tax=Inquilinus sp. CA228 TaxID=3455609 RepID=UPI003F8D3BFF